MNRKWEIVVLTIILVLGALVRGLYLSEIAQRPDFDNPGIDAHYHDYWARGLVTGDWTTTQWYSDPQIQSSPFFRAPGYPYFLALVYALTGGSYLWARIVQMLLGLLSGLLAFKLGKQWFGSTVGLIGAALVCFYWIFIYFEGELLEPALLTPLVLLMIYALALWADKMTIVRALTAGVLLGIAALVRPNFLLFAPAVLVWAIWIARRRSERKGLGVTIVVFAIGVLLAITPATIRNYVVSGDPSLIATSGGINLYLGNNPFADGYTPSAPGIEIWTSHDYPRIVEALSNQLGTPLSHSQASRIFARMALVWVKENPRAALELTLKKALLFWGPNEVSNEKEDDVERMHSKVLSRIPGRFPAVLALAVLGVLFVMYESRRRREKALDPTSIEERRREVTVLILFFIAVYFVSYLPFFVAGRFRVPLIPPMLILGACAIEHIGRFVSKREWGLAAGWLSVCVLLYFVFSVNYGGYKPAPERWYYAQGVSYMAEEQDDQAEQNFREALDINPDFPEAQVNLGILLKKQGKLDEAIALFEEAIAQKPGFGRAHANLAIALYEKGEFEEAWAEVHRALQCATDLPPDFIEALAEEFPDPGAPAE